MRKNRKYTTEEKLECIRLSNEEHLSNGEIARIMNLSDESRIRRWLMNYEKYGEEYFREEHRGRGKGSGNPYAALHTSKSLSKEERLELENLKLRIENERLKKGYMVKGVGAGKEFVTTKDVNMK
ncbi:MAG: helix-turn-helix domain-containing protein [Eubacterium sp.]|nr:helix-turn-helix domain-containing protein [Eubacterium sp.]